MTGQRWLCERLRLMNLSRRSRSLLRRIDLGSGVGFRGKGLDAERAMPEKQGCTSCILRWLCESL
jgi:hypothetical protein